MKDKKDYSVKKNLRKIKKLFELTFLLVDHKGFVLEEQKPQK